MGKIRIKTLGTEEEQAQKQKAKVRREEKKKRLTHIAGLKGGQRLVDMSTTAAEVSPPPPVERPAEKAASLKKRVKAPRERSKNYLKAKKLIEKGKLYPLDEAIGLVKKTSLAKFDGSVETHINLDEKALPAGRQGWRGQVNLPHGTGRQIKVAIADDGLLDKINSGKIDFDILVSSPAMMPKLAKVAKILGPRGLMPNPKTGTISEDPERLALSLSKGQTQFKTDSQAPIVHTVIGKVSFPNKDLEENLESLIAAIGPTKIKSIFLKSTMSPSVKVKI